MLPFEREREREREREQQNKISNLEAQFLRKNAHFGMFVFCL